MARCQCAGSSCGCLIVAGPGVDISGTGSAAQPYQISTSIDFINLTGPGPSSYTLGSFPNTLGNHTVYQFEFDPAPYNILLPDGSASAPNPPLGGEIEVIIRGGSGEFTGFAGPVINWYGAAPPSGADKRGWYRFVFMGDRYIGTFVGGGVTP